MTWLLHENLIDGKLENQFAPLSAGWVSGWMRLYRRGQAPLLVNVWLRGDFHIDIEGKVLRLKNPRRARTPSSVGRTRIWRVLRRFKWDPSTALPSDSPSPTGPSKTPPPASLWRPGTGSKIEKEREWNRLELPVAERERRRAVPAARLHTRSGENGIFQPCAPRPYLRWSSITDGEVILKPKPSQVEVLDDEASPLDGKTDREILELLERRTRVTNALLKDLGKQVSNLTRNSSKRRWF